MNKKETRWRQRFTNFEKAFLLLDRTVEIESPTEAEISGLIHFYEVSFELAWKTLKDYLESLGFSPKSPRETLKTAYQAEIINDGHLWLNALESRNLTTHIYDEELIQDIYNKIKISYFPALKELYSFFEKEYEK